jgi:hypothetical protein
MSTRTTRKTTTKSTKKAEFKAILGDSIINTIKVYNETALTAVAIAKAVRTEVEEFTS